MSQPVCAVHVASRGPRFFRAPDGVIQFKITLDRRSSIGPRPMTSEDKHQYPTAWREFQDEEAGEALAAEERERTALERMSVTDDPDAKAAHEADAAAHQAAMDKKRQRGL